MERLLSKSIVSIRNSDTAIIGTGFLANHRYIVTCAHVVRDALDLGETPPEPPDSDITLDFHSLARNEIVTAKVVYWGPQDNNDGCESDIAILRLIGFPPGEWEPAPIYIGEASEQYLFDHKYSTFGFPYANGALSYGIVKKKRPNGSFHLEDTKETGKAIVEGFSGAPIWDEKLGNVIGIVSSSDEDKKTKVAYMIPIKKIVDVFPDLLIDKNKIEYIDIPVIIYAMNTQEAKKLFDESVFNDSTVPIIEFDRYKELKKILINQGIKTESLSKLYNNSRDLWRPIIDDQKAIEVTIQEIFKENNKNFKSVSINPEFFSDEFLSYDLDIHNETLDKLGENLFVLVIDAISLYHPILREKLIGSGIITKKEASIVMLSPIDGNRFEINKILEQLINEKFFLRAFHRFEKKCEISCDLNINSMRALKRWLFGILPNVIETICGVRPHPHQKQVVREIMGDPNRTGDLFMKGRIR